jgi:drug/metabolite transporter (DMT)-like permease
MRWMLGLIAFEVLADVAAKEWALKASWLLAFTALVCYVIANTFWLVALINGMGLAKGANIFSVSTAMLALVIGLLYRESVTATQMVGMLLGMVALYLITLEN